MTPQRHCVGYTGVKLCSANNWFASSDHAADVYTIRPESGSRPS